MNLGFQFIREIDGNRQVLSFYELNLDSLTTWSCHTKPLIDIMDIPVEEKYGCGATPEEAFKDLYFKLNPGIVEYNLEEFNAALSCSHPIE